MLIFSMLIFCFSFSVSIAQETAFETPRLLDRINLSFYFGTPIYLGLEDDIKNPFNFMAGIEASIYFPMSSKIQFQTGVGWQNEFYMNNGIYTNQGDDEFKFLRAAPAFRESYYEYSKVAVPLTIRWVKSSGLSDVKNFIGLSVRNEFALKAYHKYIFFEENTQTNIKPVIHTYNPAFEINFGQMHMTKHSSFLNLIEAGIGMNLLKQDDFDLRRMYISLKIGI